MGGAGEAVNAAVLATAIRVDANFKTDIRTLIPRDDRLRPIAKKLRFTPRFWFRTRIFVDNVCVGNVDVEFFETIGWTPGRAPAVDCLTALRRLVDYRDEFPFGHVRSVHLNVSDVELFFACSGARVGRAMGFAADTAAATPAQSKIGRTWREGVNYPKRCFGSGIEASP